MILGNYANDKTSTGMGMFQRQTDSLGASYCLQLIIMTPKERFVFFFFVLRSRDEMADHSGA